MICIFAGRNNFDAQQHLIQLALYWSTIILYVVCSSVCLHDIYDFLWRLTDFPSETQRLPVNDGKAKPLEFQNVNFLKFDAFHFPLTGHSFRANWTKRGDFLPNKRH